MTIKTIQVTAARTFNHPHEDYSNLRPSVTIAADLAPDEDASAAIKELQQKAEGLVEDHKQSLLKSLEDLHQLTERQQEVKGLQHALESAQERLDRIRQEFPQLNLLPESAS